MKDILIVLRERRIVAQFCLDELSKDCENKELMSPQEANEKLEKNDPILPSFFCYCEYFIFSINSCLDSIVLLINNLESLNIQERGVSISKLYEKILNEAFTGNYADFVKSSFDEWIRNFRYIRNQMTHKSIVKIPKSLNWTKGTEGLSYCKRQINFETDNGEKIKESLPSYFQEILKSYDLFSEEFFRWLNSFKMIGNL